MPILKPRKDSESGSSLLVIIIALLALVGVIRYVTMNMDSTNKRNKEVSEAFNDANHRRFVQQVIADDQLCKVTNFLEGIKGWSLTTPTSPITVKDTGGFVDYSGVGVKGLKWPSAEYETQRPGTLPSGNRIVGKVRVTGVVFIQPTDRPVLKTEARGKTYYRIPIDVVEKGTLNGTPVLFYDKRKEGGDEPILTYIELDPDHPDQAIACYKDVSARSLCLDAGGDYDPTASVNKCLMPFQNPGDRVGGSAPANNKLDRGNSTGSDKGNRWNGFGN